MSTLTLYDIESGLLELVERCDQAVMDADVDSELAIRRSIQDYVSAEIAKADGIAYYLKEFEAREQILAREIEKLQIKRDTWRRRRDDLKAMVEGVMQASGKTKIQGATHTLTLRKNPPSVEVRQPELLPNEYRSITIKCTAEQWRGIVAVLMSSQERSTGDVEASRRILNSIDVSEPQPMKAEISQQLKNTLPMAERISAARAAHPVHGSALSALGYEVQCDECLAIDWMEQQLQLAGVPGAALVTDRVSLQVK